MESQNLQKRLTESLNTLPINALNVNAPNFIPTLTNDSRSSTDQKTLPDMKGKRIYSKRLKYC